jgi:hypothetical protein
MRIYKEILSKIQLKRSKLMVIKYQNELDVAINGQIANLQDSVIKTRNAEQAIGFGKAVVVGTVGGTDVKNIFKNKVSVTYSADFVASNSIPMSVQIGSATALTITPVVYATDHATTFAALIAAINALAGVSAVAGTGREILITVDGATDNITVSNYAVTGGVGQPTLTIAYTSTAVFEGVSVLRHGQPVTVGGNDQYEINDAVNVMTRGCIWVYVVATVAYGDDAYAFNDKAYTANQGQFTNSSSGNLAVSSGKFRSAAAGTTSTPALALLELNLPA